MRFLAITLFALLTGWPRKKPLTLKFFVSVSSCSWSPWSPSCNLLYPRKTNLLGAFPASSSKLRQRSSLLPVPLLLRPSASFTPDWQRLQPRCCCRLLKVSCCSCLEVGTGCRGLEVRSMPAISLLLVSLHHVLSWEKLTVVDKPRGGDGWWDLQYIISN